jgi:putative PIN family toxin of toxin-antitoxin system
LIEHARIGTLMLISSPALLAELAVVIRRPKFQVKLDQSKIDPEKMLRELRQLVEIIHPPPLSAPASRDRDDDAVLALAIASKADLIVSGDADLLTLGDFEGIRIVNAAEALSLARMTRLDFSLTLCTGLATGTVYQFAEGIWPGPISGGRVTP